MGELVPFPKRFNADGEPWEPTLSKRQLANHLNRTERWVEIQTAKGMPAEWDRTGTRRRYRLPLVESWLHREAS